MINYLNFILKTSMFLIVLVSCTKKTDTNTPVSSQKSSTISQNDTLNLGIYKGVFVGSSGTIIVEINNDGTITAILKINNANFYFTSNEIVLKNQPTKVKLVNDGNSFVFEVSPNGLNPRIIDININGHSNPGIIVVKETSTAVVRCYEGTFSGDDRGVFNAVIYKDKMKAISKSHLYGSNHTAEANIIDNKIIVNGNATSGAIFSGEINDNKCSGIWSNNVTLKGTWIGVRTN